MASRVCAHAPCGQPLSPTATPRSRYCSVRCKDRAQRDRDALRAADPVPAWKRRALSNDVTRLLCVPWTTRTQRRSA